MFIEFSAYHLIHGQQLRSKIMTDIIHCLKCDDTYPEKQQVVTICPTCGNDDLSETVYIQNAEEV